MLHGVLEYKVIGVTPPYAFSLHFLANDDTSWNKISYYPSQYRKKEGWVLNTFRKEYEFPAKKTFPNDTYSILGFFLILVLQIIGNNENNNVPHIQNHP